MVNKHLYIEGGESKEDQIRCRQGFRKLLENAGFIGRMPRLSACGSRTSAFSDFKTAYKKASSEDYVAMLIDSEDPVEDLKKTWDHLKTRDQWDKPEGVDDNQVLLMTTCMETWIVADRETLKSHYGHQLRENSLPPLHELEHRNRHEVHQKLVTATKECTNAYKKGKRSFELLGYLNPEVLAQHLPSFNRLKQILDEKL